MGDVSNPSVSTARGRGTVTAVITLLGVHAGMIGYSATRHSPTNLEPAQLAAGVCNWQLGRFELFRVNPPLVRMIAALPVIASGCKTDWQDFSPKPGVRSEFAVGRTFIAVNGERSVRLMTIARWACLPIALLGGLCCFLWSTELHGSRRAGILSLLLWCFSPNILAHAELVTTDMAATSFGVGAAFLFWRWLKRPTWPRTLAAGCALGLALLSKMSWLILLGLWPLLWAALRMTPRLTGRTPWACRELRTSLRADVMQLVAMLALAINLINCGYGFDRTLTPLREFTFMSQLLSGREQSGLRGNRFSDSWAGMIPVPVPREFVVGFDVQKHDLESVGVRSYLGGEWKQGGWWYYYLSGLAAKVPLGTQVLLALSVINLARGRGPAVRAVLSRQRSGRRTSAEFTGSRATVGDHVVLCAAPLLLLLIASCHSNFNRHIRYVLPVLGFLFVFLGNLAGQLTWNRAFRTLVHVGIVLASIVSSVWAYPHQLAYFNMAFGGATGGHRHLLHSNLDWGQDLLFLREWLDSHPRYRLDWLAYYGNFDPADLGFAYRLPPDNFQSLVKDQAGREADTRLGCCAMSVNLLMGDHRTVADGTGRYRRVRPGSVQHVRRLPTVGRAGMSIVIFETGRGDSPGALTERRTQQFFEW